MARPAFSLGVGASRIKTLTVALLAGSPLVAFAAHTIKLRMPERGQIVGCTLDVGLRGGTHVTSTLDVQAVAVSLLAAVFDVDALTPATPVDKEGAALSAAAASVAKDTELRIVTTESGGTAPTWADAMVSIDYVPLGD